MKEDNYLWWQERIEASFEIFDGIRIDHFRAIESYWSVPKDAATAREGKWIKGPGMDFVKSIKEKAGQKLIVAEDLGLITPEVFRLVEKSGFPGMRVMQFGFLDDSDSTHLPHNYHNNCVAYTGTHDNNTLLGYVWEMDEESRKRLLEYCGYISSDWDKGYDNIIRTLFASAAGIVIVPVQDVLLYGADTRLNTPGKADGNWAYRVTKEQIMSAEREKFARYNSLYKRN
jgi:4-alpha-glucanotransferase